MAESPEPAPRARSRFRRCTWCETDRHPTRPRSGLVDPAAESGCHLPCSIARILHISTRLILGGSQENTVLSCEGQARLGYEVHLAFGPIYGPEGSLLARVENFRAASGTGIATHIIPDLVREIHPLRDARCFSQVRELVRRLKPDIVHTHSSKAGILGRSGAWAEHVNGLRVGIVHTIHGPPFMPVEGGPVSRLKIRAANTLYTVAERYAAARCHVIVSVADAMSQQFLARGIGVPELYTTVRSGMDLAPFLNPPVNEMRAPQRAALGFADSHTVIGTVARLAQHKGHDDLLDALAPALRTHGELKLLWVGDGWWRARLVGRAKQMGLTVCELDRAGVHPSASIVLTGLVPPERVPGLMRAMDILAHPSYREGLPRTVPQALLCGIPPVAYDVDGTGEACIDGETGLLVPLGDRGALGAAILRLTRDLQLRQRLATKGFAFVNEAFDARRMVGELERVYERARALAGNSARV
ncbi:MAG: glycosyltransferase [Phycisphaerales bacterium]